MKKSKNEVTFEKVCNVINTIFIVFTIILAIYGIRIGIFKDFSILSREVEKAGAWGPVAFIFVQIVQVVVPIIPGGITLPAGVVLFGPVMGFIYNYSSICIGSIINFLIIRQYGKRLFEKIASEKAYNKYLSWLEKEEKFEKLFSWAILLPFFPDDLLCNIAGLSKMTLKKFILTIVVLKIPTIIVYSLAVDKVIEYLT